MATHDDTTESGAQCPAPESLRIYVACLAAYNSGALHGRWIDADQPSEAIWHEVQSMLADSPVPGAEEWAIHDHEGFGPLQLSEYESFERVSAIAAGIAAHGAAFAAWLSYDASLDPADLQTFEDAYRGEWNSLYDYAEDFAESIGLFDSADKIGSPYITVAIDALMRDLDIELYTVDSGHYTLYVFDPNV
jgi:antirestriction protein